jgi:hypothetical protein
MSTPPSTEDAISAALAGGIDGPTGKKRWPLIVYLSSNTNEFDLDKPRPELPRTPGLLDVLRLYDPARLPAPSRPPRTQAEFEQRERLKDARKCADLVATSALVACPSLTAGLKDEKALMDNLDAVLKDVVASYPVDAEKVYLIGNGRGKGPDGARMAWKLAAKDAWRFASVSLWDAGVWSSSELDSHGPAVKKAGEQMTGTSVLEKECGELRRLPVWIFSSPPGSEVEPEEPKKAKGKLKISISRPSAAKPAKLAAPAKPTKPAKVEIPLQDPSAPEPLIDTLSSFLSSATPAPANTLTSDLLFQSLRRSGSTKALRTILGTPSSSANGPSAPPITPSNGGQIGAGQPNTTEAASPFVVWDYWRWIFGHRRAKGVGSRM